MCLSRGYLPFFCLRVVSRYLLLALLASAPGVANDLLERDYPSAIKPLIEQRCVVCHGCYDAPCQLKMDAWAGLVRGASKKKVYDGGRLLRANLTRLYDDADSLEEWRKKSFYPVLDAREPEFGQLHRMLVLKEANPLPTSGVLPDSFDFSLARDQSCPKGGEMDAYREQRPAQGMPYGFPGLDSERRATLKAWIEDGAPGVVVAPRPAVEQDAVAAWEAFFNGESKRERLMSRYVFEHLFIGSLYFDDLPEKSGWYTLVRSRTPPGQPIDVIATRRPYSDPGVDRFYYRLQLRHLSRLAKRHMPYALNSRRMQRWTELFLEPDYTVKTLPGYQGVDAANPFITFEQLPVNARYRFMLEEAHFTIMAYIKGPVCRGQVALNVIDDHFWVAFVQPNTLDPEQHENFLAAEAREMRLPQPKGSLVVTLLQWRSYARSQQRFLESQARAIAEQLEEDQLRLDMDLIWDGGPERNDNATLTVFRHLDSASVVKGLVGQQPKTMWVIDYSLLERIHYLLVAGFDVYGAVGHQLESRLYMDFLRMEGELAFLLFLPEEDRRALRNHWYRDAKDHVRDYVLSPDNARFERPTSIRYRTKDTKSELMNLFRERIPTARNDRYTVTDESLARLMEAADTSFAYMPEAMVLQVLKATGDRVYYSLLHNRAFSNNTQLFFEEDRRLPDEDTLTVTRGFVGAYPNMFFQVPEANLSAFTDAILAMQSDDDYTRLVERFGVRRTATWFWKFSDDLNAAYQSAYPVEAGLFDLNRYQNR